MTLPRRSAVASGSGPIGSCQGLLPATPGRGEGLRSSAGDSAEMTFESSSEVLSRLVRVRGRVRVRVRVRVRARVRVRVRVRVRARVRVRVRVS